MAIKHLVLLALACTFAIALGPSASAAPSNATIAEIQAFLSPGQAYNTTTFTSGGANYTLVTISGTPSLMLDSTGALVSDQATLSQILPDYSKSVTLPFSQANVNDLQGSLASLNSSFAGCVEDYYEFETGIEVCYTQTTLNEPCSFAYEDDLAPILNISDANGNIMNFFQIQDQVGNGTDEMNQSLISMYGDSSSISSDLASNNLGQVTVDLTSLSTDSANFSSGYNLFNTGNTELNTFPPFSTYGGLARCAINTTAMANVQSEAGIASQLPNDTLITSEITSFTQANEPKAQVKLIGAQELAQATSLQATLENVDTNYTKAIGTGLTGLDSQIPLLQNYSAQVSAAGNVSATLVASGQFNTTYASLSASVQAAQLDLPQLILAISASQKAKGNVTAAIQRLGPGDAQAEDLQTSYTQLSSQLNVFEADLQQGRPVSSSQLSALPSSFNAISLQAAAAQPKEDQVNPLLIAGAIVLVVLVAGGVMLLRKYKTEAATAKGPATKPETK